MSFFNNIKPEDLLILADEIIAKKRVNIFSMLHLAPSATEAEITQAFRKFASFAHPDRNPNARLKMAFPLLSAAYNSWKESPWATRASAATPPQSSTPTPPQSSTPPTQRYYPDDQISRVNSASDFVELYKKFKKTAGEGICFALLLNKSESIFKRFADLKTVFASLEQSPAFIKEEIFHSLKYRLTDFMNTHSELIKLMEYFPFYRQDILNILCEKRSSLIKTPAELSQLVNVFSNQELAAIFSTQNFQSLILSQITTALTVDAFFGNLLSEKQEITFQSIKKILPSIIKDQPSLNLMFNRFSIEKFIELCELLGPNLEKFIKVKEPTDPDLIRTVHLVWFNHLLDTLKTLPISKDKSKVINNLYDDLFTISYKFFEKPYTSKSYEKFSSNCKTTINEARSQLRGWDDFFKKILLTIATIGIAPLILALHSKKTKGDFNFSFFANKEEKYIDEIMSSTNYFQR